MSKLFLVRHGETKLNSGKRFWGQTDVELSAAGIRQAERLRDRLLTQKIDAVYTSNLKRAVVTAGIITSVHHLDIITCTELGEMNFGWIEGLTFEEISQQYPEVAKMLGNWDIRPKFPGGESLGELNRRVSKFMPRLKNHPPEETILVIAHSGTLRLLMCHLLGIELEHWRQFHLDLGSVSLLDTYPQGAILSLLNDTSHLE
ncbi:alpha-ribazole phosphatase [Chloroflexota bacterium]